MRGIQNDESEKDLTECVRDRICPIHFNSRGKQSLLERSLRQKRGGIWEFYWNNFSEIGYRENKLDTGEDRISQRMRRS